MEGFEAPKYKVDDYIELYGSYVDDFEVSPFEHSNAWMVRDRLQKVWKKLSPEQKEKLNNYDEILIKNTKKMYHYTKRIVHYGSPNDPLRHYWWHLDKILDGTFQVKKK